MTATTSPSERPRDRIYAWALYRISILQDYAWRNCKNLACGTRDEDGDLIPCAGADCGEKRIAEEHQQELRAMRDTCTLVEWLERKEIEQAAEDDKPKRKR
jgi:hypothetical protein